MKSKILLSLAVLTLASTSSIYALNEVAMKTDKNYRDCHNRVIEYNKKQNKKVEACVNRHLASEKLQSIMAKNVEYHVDRQMASKEREMLAHMEQKIDAYFASKELQLHNDLNIAALSGESCYLAKGHTSDSDEAMRRQEQNHGRPGPSTKPNIPSTPKPQPKPQPPKLSGAGITLAAGNRDGWDHERARRRQEENHGRGGPDRSRKPNVPAAPKPQPSKPQPKSGK